MIACIQGTVIAIEDDTLIVEAYGIGYEVHIPSHLKDSLQSGSSVFLHTYLAVRQDALTLFGFETREERRFFKLLLSVDGIGPRLALAVLSTLTPDTIRRAVFNEQAELFSRVPGVGRKTAQKILLYLQDRISTVDGLAPMLAMSDVDSEVLAALTALGYSVVEAQAALQAIPRDAPQDIQSRLVIALQYFSKP
jgi:Holliday junction DNA helicase RuvA